MNYVRAYLVIWTVFDKASTLKIFTQGYQTLFKRPISRLDMRHNFHTCMGKYSHLRSVSSGGSVRHTHHKWRRAYVLREYVPGESAIPDPP